MRVAIVGTGFAGFGAAVALAGERDVTIEVFDIGLTAKLPGQIDNNVPNAKTHLGSYFTYGVNDHRWSVGLDSKRICSSHALGGHGTVYSGAILYPKDQDLTEWPEASRPRSLDYRAVLSHIDVLSENDELLEEFPVIPQNRDLLNKHDDESMALLGLSRIALEKSLQSENTTPKIFSAASYFDDLIENGRVNYRSSVYVLKVEKIGKRLRLLVENAAGQKEWIQEFDAVFLGAGCINTTGIVDRSLFGVGIREYQLKSTSICINAFCRLGIFNNSNQRNRRKNDLPEYFLETKASATSGTWSHTQITSINQQIISAISSKIPFFKGIFAAIFRNSIYFALTVVHSRLGKSTIVKTTTSHSQGGTHDHSIVIEELDEPTDIPGIREALFEAVRKHWKQLKMVPFPFGAQLADFFRGNKLGGWHFGGTLPMRQSPKVGECHPSGEVAGLDGVYVVDSAAFPEIPGSTVALLISANAHRVARQLIMKTQQKDQENPCQ